jgi:hypothetical protein
MVGKLLLIVDKKRLNGATKHYVERVKVLKNYMVKAAT